MATWVILKKQSEDLAMNLGRIPSDKQSSERSGS